MPRIDRPQNHLPQRTASTLDNNDKLSRLVASEPQLKTSQDLINHLYTQGGGTWEGATRSARDLGVDIQDLLRDRQANLKPPAPSASSTAPSASSTAPSASSTAP